MSHVDDLRWVRVFTPMHIPKYLIEQIKGRDYAVEDFYKYQEGLCLRNDNGKVALNPFSHLYAMVNKENLTKGVLWFTIDPLCKDIAINTYSVDKEYWKGGGSVKKLAEHMKDIRRKANMNKIYWITSHPKHSTRHGFRMSKSVLMEYSEEGTDGKTYVGRHDPGRDDRLVDTRTTTIPEQHFGGTAGERAASVQPILAAL